MLRLDLIIVIFLICLVSGSAQCQNNCNKNGLCNLWAKCECFTGWEGSECNQRVCPSGVVMHDIASATDEAHALGVCSGHGRCDSGSGSCKCFDGYYGADCGKSKCMNDCNGKGVCMNLRSAAQDFNGFTLNHTTVYNRWDGDIIFGCVCDPGFSGYDCSQKNCDSGNDPRASIQNNETVTLVCDCTAEGVCWGKFRLRFMGMITTGWLTPDSTRAELADVLMATSVKYRDANAFSFQSITAVSSPRYANGGSKVCNAATVTYTDVMFNRFVGDVPALSIYQNKIVKGSIKFRVCLCFCLYKL